MLQHRNSQKRIYFEDACYFITNKAFNNFPYFKEKVFCDLFVENLRLCKQLKQFRLYGWVILYDHFHLLIQPNDWWNCSKIMQFLKRHFTRDINWIFGHAPEGAIRESRLLGGDYKKFQPIIDEHDNKLKMLKSKFQQKYPNNHPFPQFRWQKSFYDHYTRNENDFGYHMEYIEYNPIKHNMPNGWPYVFTNPTFEDLADECL